MAIIRSDKPHASMYVLLVCIFLSLASLMAQSVTTPSQTSQDPSAQFEPLAGTMTPLSIPVEAFNPQAQDALVPGEVQSSSMAGAAAEPGPLITTAPESDLRPVPGGRAVAFESRYNFPAEDLPIELGQSNPNPLAQGEPESPSNSSNAKPAYCASNPALTFFGTGSIQTSICRAYFYTNSARTTWGVCTAWFATSTHAVVAGHCVANGGSGRFLPVAVGGRYGTVCCRTQSNTGPDNCQAGYGFNIINFSTTRGWLNSGTWSNDGAVLKLVRPSPTLGGVGTPLKFGQSGNPSCPATVTYAGYPILASNTAGCNTNWAERLGKATTTGVIACTTASDTPTMRYTGSSCPGMSGGPMWNPSTNIVNAILSQSHYACSTTKTSSVWFSAITNSPLSWGFHLAGLIAAVP